MPDVIWTEFLTLLAACLGSAAIAVWLMTPRSARSAARGGAGLRDAGMHDAGLDDGPVFLFDGETLIDNSQAAEPWLAAPGRGGRTDWQLLVQAVKAGFPQFPETPEEVRAAGRLFAPATAGGPTCGALCEALEGVVRVRLRMPEAGAPAGLGRTGRAGEPDFLRATLDAAPYPIWRIGDDGRTTWFNAAYLRLVRRLRGAEADLSTPVFPDLPGVRKPGRKSRISIETEAGDARLWYDVSVVRQPAGTLCFAVDINAVVDAEIAQRNFVQTLAKTFAQLSIGLAIFDRNRQLALFNPALIDLTALPADFLSGRPNLLTFFDRLRDRKMMPEPKNYSSWRDQMADLVAAAADGRYQETWSLPSGSVYSVSGRPHPDGAVAFLIEDITAEITLTRRFRSELEQGQAILDQLDDAIAVFSPDGALSFSNLSYNRLWQTDPDRSFAQVTILDTTRCWQDKCRATPIWGEIREFVSARESRCAWSAEVRLRKGPTLCCTVCPIQNGATMVRFSGPVRRGGPEGAAPAGRDDTGAGTGAKRQAAGAGA